MSIDWSSSHRKEAVIFWGLDESFERTFASSRLNFRVFINSEDVKKLTCQPSVQVNTKPFLVKFGLVFKTKRVNQVNIRWGRGWDSLSPPLPLLPLSCSPHLHLSLSPSVVHMQPHNLWPISHHRCLAGWRFFPTFHSLSHAPIPISIRQPPLSHPYSHSHLLLCRSGVIFRAQLMV